MKSKITWFFVALLILGTLACKRSVEPPDIKPTPTSTLIPPIIFTPSPFPSPSPLPTPELDPAALLQEGDQAMFDGDWEKALLSYQTAADNSTEPEFRTAAILGIGRTWLSSRNFLEAAQAFEELIEEYPQSPLIPQVHFFLGQAHAGLEDYIEASDAYLNYLILRPGVIDSYVLDLRGDVLFEAGDYGGAANDYKAAIQAPGLLDRIQLQLKLARANALSGEYGTALILYDDLLLRTNNENTRALIDLRKGQAHTALGQTDQATAAYLDAVQNYPRAYESYLALVALLENGVVVDELQRGIVDYYAGEYSVALEALERYLQTNPTEPATANYFIGLTNRALSSYDDAIEQWDIVIQNFPEHPLWDEAWEKKWYTQWAFLGQAPEAIQTLLEFVENAPDHPRAGEFLFDAAQVAEQNEDLTQAATLWERVADRYPTDERAGRSLFLSAISHYRNGDYQNSLDTFQRYLSQATTLLDRSAASFWVGKAQYALGDQTTALQTWETTASIDPTGYYSERAQDMIQDREPFTPPPSFNLDQDILSERANADEWLRARFNLASPTELSGLGPLVNEPNLIRGIELWKLGLYEQARNEFDQLRLAVETDPERTYRLANFLVYTGVYRPAILAARQVLNLAMMDDATTLSAPIYLNYLRFGSYYASLITPLADEHNFHPLFLFSVARQESFFEPFVRSSAGARGLMQIIPATGADIARNLGWPVNYTDEDLYRPLVSLTFGVDYLDTQREVFEGNYYAMLAAYNGGPGNASDWLKLAPQDQDLFLEVIRYEETRKYIRTIYEVYAIYRSVYGSSQ